MWRKWFSTWYPWARPLALAAGTAIWSEFCVAQAVDETESSDKPNELVGFVVAADGKTPVERARVVAADAVEGYILFESFEQLHFFGPDETFLLFFPKQTER